MIMIYDDCLVIHLICKRIQEWEGMVKSNGNVSMFNKKKRTRV